MNRINGEVQTFLEGNDGVLQFIPSLYLRALQTNGMVYKLEPLYEIR